MSSEKKLSDAEWRERLDEQQFHVCREKGTEPPFSGEYWNSKVPGQFFCACCGALLFDAATKFDSGTGWPSFWDVCDSTKVNLHQDLSHGMQRVEVTCASCDAHLGHLFPDGPAPTGQRYCINSVSLRFVEEE